MFESLLETLLSPDSVTEKLQVTTQAIVPIAVDDSGDSGLIPSDSLRIQCD